MTHLDDDEVNGIWYVAHTEPDQDWPAHVVEALAAELIVSRGYDTAKVAEAMVRRVNVSSIKSRPMFVSAEEWERINDPSGLVAPEFDPAEVEDEVHG